MPSNPNYFVVLPAAGLGRRFGAAIPKQYALIDERSVLEHSLMPFLNLPLFSKVMVALHPEDQYWQHLALPHSEKLITVVGGHERVDSVLNALSVLKDFAQDHDWVLVHDAVRPCISKPMILNLCETLQNDKVGGILALPLTDTLKQVNSQDEIEKTVPRKHLWCAQTPQMFRYSLLINAIKHALTAKQTITDEASALEYAGYQVKVVMGDPANIKITSPLDLQCAKFIHKGGSL